MTRLQHTLFHLPTLALVASMSMAQSDVIKTKTNSYPVHYHITLKDNNEYADISINVANTQFLKTLDFNLKSGTYRNFQANGSLSIKDSRALWLLPQENATLTFSAKISHKRTDSAFDSLITANYAIFRGDNLIPPARVTFKGKKKNHSHATLRFTLPKTWPSINTGWPRIDTHSFQIDNPARYFDRPTGWMIAGKLGTRRELLDSTDVVISAPIGESIQRMDTLALLTFIWPTLDPIFKTMPPKILIARSGNPMWRGALSASNSVFLHADRPLISENGTSTIIHELIHTISGISSVPMDDWITEGLAEYYAIEILFRAGGMTEERKRITKSKLQTWSKHITNIRTSHATGAITAKAALLFDTLDQEIQHKTQKRHSLDTITQQLMGTEKASLIRLRLLVHTLLGEVSETLETPILKLP